jgi:pantoate--beta-alanine ligase
LKVFTQVADLQIALAKERKKNKQIAFIPTMGALHQGHISLIGIGKKKAELTVCSIFINPAQFNNKNDLETYPRTLEADCNLLKKAGCNFLFVPEVIEIYPPNLSTEIKIDLKGLDKVMEGKFRPGHFEGMLKVVKRLLDIVDPDFLIMGQKDFQQFSLVNHMIQTFKMPVKLIVAPILREKNGLAMSSRNTRLSTKMREEASIIIKSLRKVKRNWPLVTLSKLKSEIRAEFKEKGLTLEYLEIVNDITLKRSLKAGNNQVICIALWAGAVRLIDNLRL